MAGIYILLIFMLLVFPNRTVMCSTNYTSYKLVNERGGLSFNLLTSTSQGRHLKMISLLESVHLPYWVPRCDGQIQLYLPPSLRPSDQPSPGPYTQLLLPNIKDEYGGIINRTELIKLFNQYEEFHILPSDQFTRFNKSQVAVMQAVTKLAVGQKDFNCMISTLVTLKEFCTDDMFVESVYNVIRKRDDIGFIIPTSVSVLPQDYLPGPLLDQLINVTKYGRVKRQDGGLEVRWNQDAYKTYPDNEPESRMWYFREDPFVNAQHYHWHRVISNDDGSTWDSDPSPIFNYDRRGEMFVFMHKQMLARYNVERLSVDMPLVTPYGPEDWFQPIYPGYSSKLGSTTYFRFSDRPNGSSLISSERSELYQSIFRIREAISNRLLDLPSGPLYLQYWNEMDFGIGLLADVVESRISSRYGSLHNNGHNFISNMVADIGAPRNVMVSPTVSMRDPLFFRWHKFIEDIFLLYKRSLGYYLDDDLDFPGVNIVKLVIRSGLEGVQDNQLDTFIDKEASVILNGLGHEYQVENGPVNVIYNRLNNFGYTYSIDITANIASRGMVRVFLIPVNVTIPDHSDVTQVAVEIDRFHLNIALGSNKVNRSMEQSPFLSKMTESLYSLQQRLMMGLVTSEQFFNGGCGWPREMAIPRGTEEGMQFSIMVIISPLVTGDRAATENWERHNNAPWSWCGVRQGSFPDNRPMGYPLDRPPPDGDGDGQGDWEQLLTRWDGSSRENMAAVDIVIKHQP